MSRRPKSDIPSAGISEIVSTRIDEADADALRAVAENYRVPVGALLRWMVEDLIDGKYLPAHLRPMKGSEKKRKKAT